MGRREYERGEEEGGVDGLAKRGKRTQKEENMTGREKIKEKKSRNRRSGLSLNP